MILEKNLSSCLISSER
uniref:Uncharacterized protein n=1 Tax=Rhizophora mucronata TaxID=61149 RepID=A0A2P2NTU9_RHIMU